MPGFVDDAARSAFKEAIRAVETASSAEVVVAVRRQSAPYLHAPLLCGIAGAIAAHAYMLYSDHPFSTAALFVDPIVAGVLIGAASTLVLGFRRWLTPASHLRARVRAAARSAYIERGIHRTRGATGFLVYVSLVEQMAEVVADDGVLAVVNDDEWHAGCDAIDDAVASGGVAVAQELAALAPILARVLPCAPDDVNELPDEVDVREREDAS